MSQDIFRGDLFKKATTGQTRTLIRHKSEASLTAVIWLFSITLIVVTGQRMILDFGSVAVFKESISFYGLGLLLISVLTTAWSFFRLFRYKHHLKKNIENPDKTGVDEREELAKFFKLAPGQVEEMRKLDCVKVQF
ncbi:MAG: PgaD family protein, partial [Nitrospiria bacterium]